MSIYNSREKLICCEYKNRGLGVRVSNPFSLKELDAEYVDVEAEAVVINTFTFGNAVPSKDWKTKALPMTEHIIGKLDQIINNLQTHRQRLQEELSVLKK